MIDCSKCKHWDVFDHTTRVFWTWVETTEHIETCGIGAAPMDGGKTQPVEQCAHYEERGK